jgi:hypothetical protein
MITTQHSVAIEISLISYHNSSSVCTALSDNVVGHP